MCPASALHSIRAWMPLISQVKRIHEYKRQLMNVMSIIHRYSEIKAMSPEERKQVTALAHQSVHYSGLPCT